MFDKIIVHANCPDGLASAMILHAVYPDTPIEFIVHNSPAHQQPPCKALFCDFSPPEHNWETWRDVGAVVLDHHATQRHIVEGFGAPSVYAHEPGRSGAVLAYEHALEARNLRWREVNVHSVERFARLAGIRDTWQTQSPDWVEACAQACALMFYGERLMVDHPPFMTNEEMMTGHILFDNQQIRARKIATSTVLLYTTRFGAVLAFNDGGDYRATSDVAEACRTIESTAPAVVAGFWYDGDHALHYSLRTVQKDGPDVGAFAKRMGGGGHRNAAGFEVKPENANPYHVLLRLMLT